MQLYIAVVTPVGMGWRGHDNDVDNDKYDTRKVRERRRRKRRVH